MSKRGVFEVRYKPTNHGRDGGFGPVKSFLTNASCPTAAGKKLRKPGIVVSVRKYRG